MQQTLGVYHPNRQKYIWLLVMSAVFVAIGWAISDLAKPKDQFVGFCVGVGFALLGLFSILQLLPGSLQLKATSEGLYVRTSLWTTYFYRWTDIEKFGVAEYSVWVKRSGGFSGMMITQVSKGDVGAGSFIRRAAFNFSASYAGGGAAWENRELNQNRYGFDCLLPDDYGMDQDELARQLNEFRERWSQSAKAPSSRG